MRFKQVLITSKPLFVYLQRPDTEEWVTVGRYQAGAAGSGYFRYAPSYADAGLSWSIDPVNLPFQPDVEFAAPRYGGLHDILRDACPDGWGQALLRREHNLPQHTPPARFLVLASNADRWGAIAVGARPKPSVAALATPRLPQLHKVIEELAALNAQQPPVHAQLRRRLVQTASVGGARPKATLQDEQGDYWLLKPALASDVADIPSLEHAAQRWGALSGLRFAATVLHPSGTGSNSGHSALRVRRFDRNRERRAMCVSAATLLQAEYPGKLSNDRWSYPRLAEELRRIGAPAEDRRELFGRMVFNAVCGNDDDHPRNHAVVFDAAAGRWRLAPAFDVVPNPADTPPYLAMQLSSGRFDIARDALLADAHRFGFDNREAAGAWLDAFLVRVAGSFDEAALHLDPRWREMLAQRLQQNLSLLRRRG